VLKRLSFVVSNLYTLILTALSLIKLNNVVKHLPSFNDNFAHLLAHFIFVILWFIVFYYKFNIKYYKALAIAALLSLGYGILMELLQGWITATRQSEYNDVCANVIGMMFAVLFLASFKQRVLKK